MGRLPRYAELVCNPACAATARHQVFSDLAFYNEPSVFVGALDGLSNFFVRLGRDNIGLFNLYGLSAWGETKSAHDAPPALQIQRWRAVTRRLLLP